MVAFADPYIGSTCAKKALRYLNRAASGAL
jgi:hypothetical protein